MKLTADSPAYLRDHALDGMLVVPAAAYLTMALESVQSLGTPVALRDVTFPEALRFPMDGSRTLRLTASASQFGFASLRDEAKPFAEASWTTHCSGSFDNAQPATPVDLPALQARLHEEQERNTDAGFAIGPSFRWTKGVRLAANEALCRMEPPLATHELHPGLLDSCLRTLGLFAAGDALYAPFHVDALHVLGRTAGPMWCHVQLTEATAEHFVGNVRLLDEHGTVLLDITGLEARALRKRDPLYAIEWQRLDAPANASES